MYAELFKKFNEAENLGGKAWQHAVTIDLLEKNAFKDCSMHCFHYQQMLEMFFKYLLEIKSKFGAYSHTHNLNKLLEQLTESTAFKTNKSNYRMALQVITVCAEEYHYNFLIDCEGYKDSVEITNQLIKELLSFESNN